MKTAWKMLSCRYICTIHRNTINQHCSCKGAINLFIHSALYPTASRGFMNIWYTLCLYTVFASSAWLSWYWSSQLTSSLNFFIYSFFKCAEHLVFLEKRVRVHIYCTHLAILQGYLTQQAKGKDFSCMQVLCVTKFACDLSYN